MKDPHILLTTDLSEESKRAFEPVADLAELIGARITLLYVVPMLTETVNSARLGTPIGVTDYEYDVRNAEVSLANAARELSDRFEVDRRVVLARHVAKAIARTADEVGAGLIAMCTHGRTGFRRLVLGSVAEETLRHAKVPVICFPVTRALAAAHEKGEAATS